MGVGGGVEWGDGVRGVRWSGWYWVWGGGEILLVVWKVRLGESSQGVGAVAARALDGH